MNIGEAADTSGVSAKLIRHYESIGLIKKAKRTASGYRVYADKDIHELNFIRKSRNLGFSMQEIKQLLGLWRNKSRASADVKQLAVNHIEQMEEKISELQSMVDTLKHLSKNCRGDNRPNCPILDNLAETTLS